ncbi:MAG: hypothetical protein AAGG75_27330 [Bacteroidota bacterium]
MSRTLSIRKYTFEFLCIFIAVISAFALNNWNDNRRDRYSEDKILREIKNGLQLDLQDISVNKSGHQMGIRSCTFYRALIKNGAVAQDSLPIFSIILTRDFTSIMNQTGYESLKSKGLEIVTNDSVRIQIITLYDYYYQIIRKLEESVPEMQSFQTYFMAINEALAPYMEFNERGVLKRIQTPLRLAAAERKQLLSFLWRIESNRLFKLNRYNLIEQKIEKLIGAIDRELAE